jgi:hypothetical protein
MPEPAVTAEIHKPFDIHGNFGSKLPFHLEFTIDYLTNAVNLSLGKIVCIGIRIHLQFTEDTIGSSPSDTINIGQTNFNPFTSR